MSKSKWYFYGFYATVKRYNYTFAILVAILFTDKIIVDNNI